MGLSIRPSMAYCPLYHERRALVGDHGSNKILILSTEQCSQPRVMQYINGGAVILFAATMLLLFVIFTAEKLPISRNGNTIDPSYSSPPA